MANLQTKVCTICKLSLPVSGFYKAKTKLGNPTIRSRCITCERERDLKKYRDKQEAKLKTIVPDLDGEIWANIEGYSKYQVSNMARVKRLGYWKYKEIAKKEIYYEEIVLSQIIYGGYHFVTLYSDLGIKSPSNVYSKVYFSFNPNQEKIKGYEVDHIDNDKLNSKISNLQYIKTRANSAKRSLNMKNKASKYTGVCKYKVEGKWYATIRVGKQKVWLGVHNTQEEAAQAYQTALKQL